MLNSTFIDEPDTSDEWWEAIAEHVKTIDQIDETSEFVSNWIEVQEEPKWLFVDEKESEDKWWKPW